jgi:hypothetical protein
MMMMSRHAIILGAVSASHSHSVGGMNTESDAIHCKEASDRMTSYLRLSC